MFTYICVFSTIISVIPLFAYNYNKFLNGTVKKKIYDNAKIYDQIKYDYHTFMKNWYSQKLNFT
jgi:hypothetical protein